MLPLIRNLIERIIIDEFGNEKIVLVDDEGNIIDAKDVE